MTSPTTSGQEPLYWATDGSIACLSHAPFRGSDTWVTYRWHEMSARDRSRSPWLRCETCAYIAKRKRAAS